MSHGLGVHEIIHDVLSSDSPKYIFGWELEQSKDTMKKTDENVKSIEVVSIDEIGELYQKVRYH